MKMVEKAELQACGASEEGHAQALIANHSLSYGWSVLGVVRTSRWPLQMLFIGFPSVLILQLLRALHGHCAAVGVPLGGLQEMLSTAVVRGSPSRGMALAMASLTGHLCRARHGCVSLHIHGVYRHLGKAGSLR